MTIRSIQKVIKIGSSLAVTIPARDARAAGLEAGSDVDVSVKLVAPKNKQSLAAVDDDYEEFKKQYGETLKNLADR